MTGLFWHPLYSLSILWIRRPQQASPKVHTGRLKVEPAGGEVEGLTYKVQRVSWKVEAEARSCTSFRRLAFSV